MNKTKSLFVIVCTVLMVMSTTAQFSMKQGNYAVGFDLQWTNNPFLTYSLKDGQKKNHKPVLLGIWYPAEKSTNDTLSVKDYIQLKGLEELPEVKEAYSKIDNKSWEDNAISYLVENKTVIENCYQWLLEYKGVAQLQSTPITSKFPVVIYQHGGGESYNENFLLFEYLASHGYVVISSQYWTLQNGVPLPLNWYDAKSDVQCIVNHLPQLNYANENQLTFMGHSQGAQYGYGIVLGDHSPFKAFVSLDPTWHNFSLGLAKNYWGKEHGGLLEAIENKSSQMHPEMLELSGLFEPEQNDPLYDSLNAYYTQNQNAFLMTRMFKHANRHTVTIGGKSSEYKGMEHDSFLSQGALAFEFLSQQDELLNGADSLLISFIDNQPRYYAEMNQLVLLFLNKVFKSDPKNEEVWQSITNNQLKKGAIQYEHLAAEPVKKSDEFWNQLISMDDDNLSLLQQQIKDDITANGATSFKYVFPIMFNHITNPELAFKISEIHLKLGKDQWYSYFVHANLLHHTGDTEKALLYYEKALKIAPKDHVLTKKMNDKKFNDWSLW